jgi:hypothetical protein
MSISELAGVVIAKENALKEMLVEYVGNKFATESRLLLMSFQNLS